MASKARVVECLAAARALIAKQESVPVGVMAVTAEGERRDPSESDACSFCALGALDRASMDMGYSVRRREICGDAELVLNAHALAYLVATHQSFPDTCAAHAAVVNDELGKDAVLAVYDLAIEAVSK